MHKRKGEDLEVADHNVKVEVMKSLKRLVANKTFCTILSFEKIENVIEKWTLMVTNFREFRKVPRSFLLYCSVLLWPTSSSKEIISWSEVNSMHIRCFFSLLCWPWPIFRINYLMGQLLSNLGETCMCGWIVVRDHPSKLWMT